MWTLSFASIGVIFVPLNRIMKQLDERTKQRRVAYWLLVGVFMIIIQIIIGGVTRLTGSGLSITEWNPIMGAIPPLNDQEWLIAFEKYKGIAQFKYLNASFTVSDFKFIFFWEWFHRLWARSLGVVFAIPFIYFIIKKYFSKDMIGPLVLLFVLGGLQGLVGWIMVQSGLNDTDIYVSHIRLSIHFMSAIVLLVYTFWFAIKLLVPQTEVHHNSKVKNILAATITLLTIQLLYGGFMAGLKAAIYAPTWPSMNGVLAPNTLVNKSLISEPLNVQFIHRMLAYILLILLFWSYFLIRKELKDTTFTYLSKSLKWPFFIVFVQVTLGVLTVLSALKITPGKFGLFETLAELHQIVGIALLLSLVYQYFLVRKVN